MRITLTVTSGARNGLSKHFDQAYIGLGRHPQSDLQFHPDHDLDASTRHAAILKSGEHWSVRDLGSANGTFVNGEKVIADRRLHTGDQLRIGSKGPVVTVEVAGEAAPTTPVTRLSGSTPALAGMVPGSTTQRIRAEVAKQTQHLRRATLVLFGLLLLVAGGYFVQKATYERRISAQQDELRRRADSLDHELAGIKANFSGVQAALDAAQAESQQLRDRITAGGSSEQLGLLRRQLNDAIGRQQGLRAAAGLDGAHVDSIAGDAVALVFVKFPDGRVFTGTAFAVKTDANGALMITNRHVVTSPEGEDPIEIGVMFNHSRQTFRAQLVRKHPDRDVDMALLRVEVRGGTPVVPGIGAEPPTVGQPVVAIGFPLGVDLEGGRDFQRTGASATLVAGTISRLTTDLVQIDGYGATGASGSPILDQHGHVVGVLYGGQAESGGRIVYAEPARFIAGLLQGQQ